MRSDSDKSLHSVDNAENWQIYSDNRPNYQI